MGLVLIRKPNIGNLVEWWTLRIENKSDNAEKKDANISYCRYDEEIKMTFINYYTNSGITMEFAFRFYFVVER